MKALGLDHIQIAIPVGEEPLARTFYAQLLGLSEVEKPPSLAGRGGLWFENGALKVHLGVDPQFVPAKKAHPGFKVADIAALAQELKLLGFEVESGAPILGVRRIFTYDPFGNRIEFLQAE